MKTIGLIGNPNCGKTTLFNWLTGANQHVGNWSGVTVERKEGIVSAHGEQICLVDLPGVYALAPYTLEERITRDFLLDEHTDLVINILDGTSMERGLYLTMQLCELGCPMVIAVGMMDEVRKGGGWVDCAKLQELLGVPVIPIAARQGENLEALMEAVVKPVQAYRYGTRYHASLESAILQVFTVISGGSEPVKQLRFHATALLEGEENVARLLGLTSQQRQQIAMICKELEQQNKGMDAMTVIADARYRLIGQMLKQAVGLVRWDQGHTDEIDRIVLHRWMAFPILCLVLFLMFFASFGSFGMAIKQTMEWDLRQLTQGLQWIMVQLHVSKPLQGLVSDGIMGGVGTVLVFLPQIALIFLSLTILEECGYLSRAAFLMDLPLRKLGLTGKSFIPMLMGFGCTTPAVMAARTLENQQDRRRTILLTPYLPCSAKFPVYALLAGVFFPENVTGALLLLYLLGIVTAISVGWFLKKASRTKEDAPFLMEFPPYRMPTLRNILRNTWEKCWDFLSKAGTLIFLMSIAIWMLQHFDVRLQFTWVTDESIFWLIGGWIAPIFVPLGFESREAAVALLAGLSSKEAVVATLGVLCNANGSGISLTQWLSGVFTPLSAASFLVFCGLYMPCISAFSTMRRELNSTRFAIIAALGQTAVAYAVSLGVYQLGSLWNHLVR